MRTRGVLLAVSTLVAAAAPAAAAINPGASYPWAQAGATRPAATHSVQPPAWVPISAPTYTVMPLPGSSYPWAQYFGTRPAGALSVQPPAGIIPF